MLLLKLFSVQVHSCEIQINLRSVVTNFSMATVFRLATLSKRNPTPVFSCEYCKIFKNTYFEGHLRTPAYEYHFTYYFRVLFLRLYFNVLLSIMIQRYKRCKDNVVLSTILRRCCDVLITYQQHNNVAWTSFKWRYFYNVGGTSWWWWSSACTRTHTLAWQLPRPHIGMVDSCGGRLKTNDVS